MTLAPRPIPPGLAKFWSGPVSAFATLQPNVITPQDAERHRIFSLLLMGMLLGKWNGNKDGESGNYGNWRAKQVLTPVGSGAVYRGGTYQGHNIAALAVDGEGRIIDFEFNHNAVLDSTVEHAESRLVRRVFALNQLYEPWLALDGDGKGPSARRARRPHQRQRVFATAASDRPAPSRTGRDIETQGVPAAPSPYSTLLKDVTIYTSLESCAQCSGIMCLGSVKDIVYLQWDQGQFLVGNIMWQATTAQAMGFIAPRPIRGDEFGFQYFNQLNTAFDQFANAVGPSNPFYTGVDKHGMTFTDIAKAVTSFLCTDAALAIYQQAAAEFGRWTTLSYPTYQPTPSALTNKEALTEAKDFLGWVDQLDNRGAPHRV